MGLQTTLLDSLAERVSTGVITGDRFVNGNPLARDFTGQTGYCQQLDIHMPTTSKYFLKLTGQELISILTAVCEALMSSAEPRQPASVSRAEKRA